MPQALQFCRKPKVQLEPYTLNPNKIITISTGLHGKKQLSTQIIRKRISSTNKKNNLISTHLRKISESPASTALKKQIN